MSLIHPIAHIRNAYTGKFGIPRQSNLVKSLKSTIVFCEGFRSPDALRGLETFSHIWLIWGFSQAERENWSPTVRPPRLGGNARLGVFATRSPFRPNPIGLSCVELEGIEATPQLGHVIHVRGADLMNDTPIYDIKPYIPYCDCHPEAASGFALPPEHQLNVVLSDQCQGILTEETWRVVEDLLAYDPRPSYQKDPERMYGMRYGAYEIKFSVSNDILTVHQIMEEGEQE